MDDRGSRRRETAAVDHVQLGRVRSLEHRGTEQRRRQRGLCAGDVDVLVALERRAVSLVTRLLCLSDLTHTLTTYTTATQRHRRRIRAIDPPLVNQGIVPTTFRLNYVHKLNYMIR